QKKAIGKMQDISKTDGRTVLFVSHNMAAVKSLCTRVMVLEHGKTVFEGETEDGIDYYLSSKNTKIANYEDFTKHQGICKIEVLNTKDQLVDKILVGQQVKLKVKFKNPRGRALSIAFAFYGSHDEFLFGCRSDVVDKTYSGNQGEAILVIEKWPLSKGIYTYNTSVHDANTVVENLKEVGQLYVEEGDYYGFGKLPASTKRGFYTNYSWQ